MDLPEREGPEPYAQGDPARRPVMRAQATSTPSTRANIIVPMRGQMSWPEARLATIPTVIIELGRYTPM
jgi:hypothetical protein